MSLRVSLFLMMMLSLVAGSALALDNAIPVTGGQSVLQVQETRGDAQSFHVEVGEIQTMGIQTDAGLFTRLVIPGFHSSKTEGAPELPMMNRLMAVPLGADARIVVENVQTRTIKLADYGIDSLVMPAQPSLAKNQTPQDVPFAFDRAAYQASVAKAGDELVQVVPMGRMRAMDFARVEVSPVSYRPLTGELDVVESLDFRVEFDGADSKSADDLYATTYSPFFEHLYTQIAGPEMRAFQDSYPDRVADVVTLVIVTPPEFVGQLADFIAWKTERGFKVITAVTGTAEVGTTTSSIQSYLHGLYNNATVEDPAPSFVIFVGDVAQMPTFSESGNATDRPYCAVDGDLVPDMYYGRFSATNATQLQNILDKTMMYDQFTMPDPSYLDEVVMIAGYDTGYGASHGNGQINYGTEHYFNAAHGITSHTYLYPASGSSDAAIVADVSSGVAFANYTAHGSETSWADPSFTQSNINNLNNSGKYLLAIGNCCLTSTYDYSECFAETWLRAEDKGAIGYIGGSNSTYWDEDYWFGVGYHASSQIDGTAYPYESTGLGAYDGLFHDHGEDESLHYVTNDAIVFAGNLAVMESGSSLITYYWNIYNLMGDPSLSTFLGVPTANAVSTSGMSPSGVTVYAEPGSYVGFTEDGTLVGAGTVGTTGSVAITFTTTPSGASPLHMVVMAQNKIPYTEDLNVASPAIVVDVTSFDEELAPDGTVTRNMTISNTGESGSVLVYDIGVQAENPGVKKSAASDKSVAGSTLVVDNDAFYAGTTLDLVFTVTNGSTDVEWLTDISLDFPAGMTVNSSTAFTGGSSPMSSNGETGDGVAVTWHGETSSGWGVIEGGESATATLNVTFDSGLAGSSDIAWSIQGDIYGSTPHSLTGNITMTAQGPSITLSAPNGGEVLGIGTATDVTWTSGGGFTGPVMIELSRDGGSSWETIVASTTDDGSESWTVTGPSSTDCLVRVGTLDGSVRDAGDAAFTIYQPVNWLTVSPLSGSVADGSSDVLDVDFDATGMALGTHTAYIVINNNTSSQPEVVPVTMVVADGSSGVDVPFNFALRGNYPNPFNPVTAIAYSIPKADNVLLQVIDVRGRVVSTLVDGQQAAGEHTVRWDGTNTAGVTVASGVYFSRLVVGDQDAVSKMTLTK